MERLLVVLAVCTLCPWSVWAEVEQESEPESEPESESESESESECWTTNVAYELPPDLTAAQLSRIEQCRDSLSEAQFKDFIFLPKPQRWPWLDKYCPTVVKPLSDETRHVDPGMMPVGPLHEPILLSQVVAHSMFWSGLGICSVGLVSCGFASEYCKEDPGLTMAPTLIVGSVLILGSLVATVVKSKQKRKRENSIALSPLKTGFAGAWTQRF